MPITDCQSFLSAKAYGRFAPVHHQLSETNPPLHSLDPVRFKLVRLTKQTRREKTWRVASGRNKPATARLGGKLFKFRRRLIFFQRHPENTDARTSKTCAKSDNFAESEKTPSLTTMR